MKLDSNNLPNGEESANDSSDSNNENSRQNAADLIDDILSQFTYQRQEHNPLMSETSTLIDMLQHTLQIRPPVQLASTENGTVDGIDPSSPLGNSLRNKFTELEAISQRLKSRLNQVCDENIILSPDTEFEADLERDLNTDCQDEDLSPQEFSVLMRSVQSGTSQQTNLQNI